MWSKISNYPEFSESLRDKNAKHFLILNLILFADFPKKGPGYHLTKITPQIKLINILEKSKSRIRQTNLVKTSNKKMTSATTIMYRKVVEFLFVIFVATTDVAKGKPLIDSAPNVNFCMADPGKCDSNIYLNFSQIFTQFGCAERCSQYENCNW